MYNGFSEPINWIICDGVKRCNENNIFNSLIDLGIGEKEDEYYIPPNYSNTVMASINDHDEKILHDLYKNTKDSAIIHGIHVFKFNNEFVKEYNNIYINVFEEDVKYLQENNNVVTTKNIYVNRKLIKWLIRYRLD